MRNLLGNSTTCRLPIAIAVLVVLVNAISNSIINAQVATFQDVSADRGIEQYFVAEGFGGGVAATDFDGDGDIDIFLPQEVGHPDRLYENLGNGYFRDIAPDVGLDALTQSRVGLWFDYDNDRLLDLFVAGDCFNGGPKCAVASSLHLYRQLPSGQFEDVTAEAGLDMDAVEDGGGHRSAVCCGDLDRDGDLDLMVGLWNRGLRMLRNDAGVFHDITAEALIDSPVDPWQSVIHDFNQDGWMDVYSAVDFAPNRLWINQHDGTFVDMAPQAGVDTAFNDMGVSISDYDNDGDIDIYVTNIFEDGKYNTLLRNDTVSGVLSFADVSAQAGVDNTNFGWGNTFLDVNNDGYLDLAVTNGWFNGIGYEDRSHMFLNRGDNPVTFEDVSDRCGFNDNMWGWSLVSADIDRDGDLDLLQTTNLGGPFRILENRLFAVASNTTNWLCIRPRQAHLNYWSIGAVVRVEAGGKTMTRVITAGMSQLGQEPAEAYFGLGRATTVDRIVIRWPLGHESVWENVPANQMLNLFDADLDGDSLVGLGDLRLMFQNMGPCNGNPCAADLNHDETVNFTDVFLLRSVWSGK